MKTSCGVLSSPNTALNAGSPPPPQKEGGQVKTKTDVATLMKMQIEPNIKP